MKSLASAILDGYSAGEARGTVNCVKGLIVECVGLRTQIGSICVIDSEHGKIRAEVVGFKDDTALLMTLDEMLGIKNGDPVFTSPVHHNIPVCHNLMGRVVDSFGNPLDEKGAIKPETIYPLYSQGANAMDRPVIDKPLETGVKSIDALLTIGKGQRVGLFSGSGVGKSVLLGMIARNTKADVTVVALVGERTREVRQFIENDLGTEGLKNSVIVVETGQRPAPLRVRAPFAATAIAEYFRDKGMDVLLLMDSVTRMAIAQREIGLSAGEPPAVRGYPPSVYAMMPRLMERAGKIADGSITGVYAVLVEADDMNETISDMARSILDGHIWLSRDLANMGQYPAIDVLASVSRLMTEISPADHVVAARSVKKALAVLKSSQEIVNLGAYVKGSNPEIDSALAVKDRLLKFLTQEIKEKKNMADAVNAIKAIAAEFERPLAGTGK